MSALPRLQRSVGAIKRNMLVARVLVVAGAAVFALAVGAVIFPAQSPNPRDAGSTAGTRVAPGETLVVAGLEYRSVGLEFKKEVQWGKTAASVERAAGQWAIVRVDVTNTTGQYQRIPWLRVWVRDPQGGAHRLNDSLSRLLSGASEYGSIDDAIGPGARLTTLFIFDVPTTRSLTLDVQGGLLQLN